MAKPGTQSGSPSGPTLQELVAKIPLARETVNVGPQVYKVWLDNPQVTALGRGIVALQNDDLLPLRKALVDRLLREAPDTGAETLVRDLGSGGNRVRDLYALNDPVFELVDKRVRVLYMAVYGRKDAVVDDVWANIVTAGEWAFPHAHKRAEAAAVLSLQPTLSEDEHANPSSGQFYIADPRVPFCCPEATGYVTNSWMPMMGQTCMIMIFPAFITHGVFPHQGETPRLSIAWNLNAEKLAGEVSHDGSMDDWKAAR